MSAEAMLDVDGPAAPPRSNGELVFAAPWQRRLFGVTMVLTQRIFGYEDFRQHLIERVRENPERDYWESWALAVEDALAGACALDRGTLDERHRAFLARPHGHDH
ncbi:SH3-like domain-containing protein [Smaragdicoccus niigatensis]|uniref:SH3-like domain-containing protein n=1 Tax=Smaragdicoccus niigatensis TaxID=359359 RepID=UPI00036071E2|nr:SH3-like domain-containing protein [Smaragdicoccus niigatensis]